MSLGSRIRISRHAEGLSLRDLEAKIDNLVTAQAISKYERDESIPSSGVLIALANALGVSVRYLFSESEIALETVEFRSWRLASRREEARVEARVLDLLERYLTVEEILNLPSVVRDIPRDAPWPVLRYEAEAEQAALCLRSHWGLGTEPIPHLIELLEGRGIKVLSMPLTGTDGLTCGVRRGDRCIASVIVVNRTEPGERQRFNVAQQLGHLVLDVAPKVDDEEAAQRFAGAFLMPAATLRAEVGKHRNSIGWSELFDLKRTFGVSVGALTHRCRELGIIRKPLFRQLFDEFNRLGWRSLPFREPWAMDEEGSKRFRRLCLRALAEGAVSRSRAAELLGLPISEIDRLMYEPPCMETASADA